MPNWVIMISPMLIATMVVVAAMMFGSDELRNLLKSIWVLIRALALWPFEAAGRMFRR
jgi:hypothetical protein